MTTPSPSLLAKSKRPVAAPKPTAPKPTAVVVHMDPTSDAKIVRPGLRSVVVEKPHDGVVKAKNLKPGQVVRAWLHGEPKGGERVVESIEKIDDGAGVRVTFSSAHPVTDYKAAYRFYDAALVGTPVQSTTQVPALVAYEEV